MARMAETMIFTVGTAAYGYDNPGDKLLEDVIRNRRLPVFPLARCPGHRHGAGYLSHNQIGETSQNKGLGAETGELSAERIGESG